MRKTTLFLVLACGIAWASCKKSSSTAADPVIPKGMYAKVNGATWAATNVSYSSVTGGPNYIDVYGYDTAGITIDLRIYNFTTRGSNNVPQKNDSIFYSTDFGVMASPVAATSGNIKIEAVTDTTVGGTFSFTAGSITVTNGTFETNYN